MFVQNVVKHASIKSSLKCWYNVDLDFYNTYLKNTQYIPISFNSIQIF